MIRYDMPFLEYAKAPGVNASFLKAMRKTPAHALYEKCHPEDEPSEALILGKLEHTLVFECEKLNSEYEIFPDKIDGRTKEGKEQKAQMEAAQAAGKTAITGKQLAWARAMGNSVCLHPEVYRLLTTGKPEVSIFTELNGGTPAKARLDWLTDDNWIVDLKTTKDASQRGFARSVAEFGYHIQQAWYMELARLEGIPVQGMVFIAAEKNPPYLTAVYQLTDRAVEFGRDYCVRAMSLYRECVKHDKWPGYSRDIQSLDLPPWYYKSYEYED